MKVSSDGFGPTSSLNGDGVPPRSRVALAFIYGWKSPRPSYRLVVVEHAQRSSALCLAAAELDWELADLQRETNWPWALYVERVSGGWGLLTCSPLWADFLKGEHFIIGET